MRLRLGCGMLALALMACRSPPRTAASPPLPTSVDALAAAIAADASRSEQAPASTLGELAADAGRDADACLARAPQAAACLYGRALAYGLEARVHPTRAGELLRGMQENLAGAEAADAGYDEAGPARVRALLLLRAPGWPLGPGDAAAGLSAAQRAVALRPAYPPNLLALAEGLGKTGDAAGARAAYQRARDAAQALPAAADRDGWLREAEQALRRE